MTFEYSHELVNDFEKLFMTEKGYDVIIYAGDNENIKEFHAHSVILCTRSQYFCTALSNEWAKKQDGKFIFKKPNISPKLFNIVLRFIYCTKIDLTELQGSEVLNLLIVVDELNIQSLITCIQDYLVKHQEGFLQQNPTEILETVYQHESFIELWNYYLKRICEEPEVLFNSDKFINLKAPLLKLLLKQDDLCLHEIVIWNSLLKWGLAQNPSISKDTTKWNNEDIIVMERTLHEFIPLVRFYHLSSNDFLDKVFPLKKLLPEGLVDDLLIFYIAPDRKPNVQLPRQSKFIYDSTLVNQQYFAILSSWIDKKENSSYNKNIPYQFNLLYRASRDGNNHTVFHTKCDYKGQTIFIAKISNSEKIVGGYNPFQWESNDSWKSTRDSFIYLFEDRKDIKTARVSYSNGNQISIKNHPLCGPIFGNGDLYFDRNGYWYSTTNNSYSDYPKINGIPNHFIADDYEVFQIIKK
ncbi:hypothetical protein RclHR1_08210002 [Rhizophagus clarus]|uniref:BTB/POZ domain-containing protein n=1 Tax=Rhizophagus clarus TaxID=94130 RepID=A0A2Z6SMQ0_9GLOM|nr:hypothetical protein RclHR1_08210002 [Rhizophagus clarus]GES85004.1 BTB/POZ domain-containing protein [Rhizophagus clarus]